LYGVACSAEACAAVGEKVNPAGIGVVISNISPPPAPTVISANPATKHEGNFSATVRRSDIDVPVSGLRVLFTVRGLFGERKLCEAVSNGDGTAACHAEVPPEAVLATNYNAYVLGDDYYRPSSGNAAYSV
jgi:hypothetical protein